MVSSVSPEAKHTPATVMTVSRELPAPPVSDSSLLWRAPEGPEGTAVPVGAAEPGCGARGRRWGQAAVPVVGGGVRLRCPWAVAGPSRGAGGWRQGQGGPRDRPLRAAGSRVAISRAGRRPPAHTAAGPQSSTTERPEHQRRHEHHNNRHHTNAPRHTKNRHPDRMSACGGARGIRTPDLLIANETRYQLRHSPKDSNSLAPSQSATQADHRRVRHAARA